MLVMNEACEVPLIVKWLLSHSQSIIGGAFAIDSKKNLHRVDADLFGAFVTLPD
jgi:hypothetical protein